MDRRHDRDRHGCGVTARSRFAPSPTGPLHLGHALSALTAERVAREVGGEFILRIEDTDSTRCRPEHEAGIQDDLRWLGIAWDGPVRRQSEHRAEYLAAADILATRGYLYPCSCTRREIAEAGATVGNEGLVYPGTCRSRPMNDRRRGDALRLNLGRALEEGPLLTHEETGPLHSGTHVVDADFLIRETGDPVLVRKDTGDPAYHLAVVHDDAVQAITHVVRGDDLWNATPLHRLLQHLLGLPVPVWYHHDLIRDASGKRLAKIDGARALSTYRAAGSTPADVMARIGWSNSRGAPSPTEV